MEFRKVNSHVEVYNNKQFLFSADNIREAEEELKLHIKIRWLFVADSHLLRYTESLLTAVSESVSLNKSEIHQIAASATRM